MKHAVIAAHLVFPAKAGIQPTRSVIPAQAGIQGFRIPDLAPRLRGDDAGAGEGGA